MRQTNAPFCEAPQPTAIDAASPFSDTYFQNRTLRTHGKCVNLTFGADNSIGTIIGFPGDQ